MAASVNRLSFLFLLFIASSLQTHARDNMFFSKIVQDDSSVKNPEVTSYKPEYTKYFTKEEIESVMADDRKEPEAQDTPSTQVEPTTTLPLQSGSGFGLYGRDPEQIPVINSGNSPNLFPTKEFHAESYTFNGFASSNTNNDDQNKDYGNAYEYYYDANDNQNQDGDGFQFTTDADLKNNDNYGDYSNNARSAYYGNDDMSSNSMKGNENQEQAATVYDP